MQLRSGKEIVSARRVVVTTPLIARIARKAAIAAQHEDAARRVARRVSAQAVAPAPPAISPLVAIARSVPSAWIPPRANAPRRSDPIEFLEESWTAPYGNDEPLLKAEVKTYITTEDGSSILAPFAESERKTILVTYHSELGDVKERLALLPKDGLDFFGDKGFYEKLDGGEVKAAVDYFYEQHMHEVKMGTEFYRVHSVDEYEPFTELDILITNGLRAQAEQCGGTCRSHTHELCYICSLLMRLCDEYKHLGTFGLGNLFVKHERVVVENAMKSPCSCGIFVFSRIMGIAARLVDAIT